jgi:hypothetical protein
MREWEFWRERATGHIFAVAFDEGRVSGCCGPLDMSEVDDDFLPTFDYAGERAGWFEEHREGFDLFRTTAPYG